MFRNLLIAGSLFISFAAAALELKSVDDPTTQPLATSDDQPSVPCDQIITALDSYNKMAKAHDQSIVAFLANFSDVTNTWYSTLSPLENTPQTLPVGVFKPLADGAAKVSSLTDMVSDNSRFLVSELQRLIDSLRVCKISN